MSAKVTKETSELRAGAVSVLMPPDLKERMRKAAMLAAGLGVGPWLRMLGVRELQKIESKSNGRKS
jgi:ferredoxin-NADP reductase